MPYFILARDAIFNKTTKIIQINHQNILPYKIQFYVKIIIIVLGTYMLKIFVGYGLRCDDNMKLCVFALFYVSVFYIFF